MGLVFPRRKKNSKICSSPPQKYYSFFLKKYLFISRAICLGLLLSDLKFETGKW